jgi:hypothetical protein
MFFIIFIFTALVLSYMTFVDYSNGKLKAAAISGGLALLQFVIIGLELLEVSK